MPAAWLGLQPGVWEEAQSPILGNKKRLSSPVLPEAFSPLLQVVDGLLPGGRVGVWRVVGHLFQNLAVLTARWLPQHDPVRHDKLAACMLPTMKVSITHKY